MFSCEGGECVKEERVKDEYETVMFGCFFWSNYLMSFLKGERGACNGISLFIKNVFYGIFI